MAHCLKSRFSIRKAAFFVFNSLLSVTTLMLILHKGNNEKTHAIPIGLLLLQVKTVVLYGELL